MRNRGLLLVLLAFVVISSGCISAEGDELDGKEIDVEEVETNETSEEILDSALENFEQKDSFEAESNHEMTMNAFIISLDIDLETESNINVQDQASNEQSEGVFRAGLPVVGSNETSFETMTNVSENVTEVYRVNETTEGGEWQTENVTFEEHPLRVDQYLSEDIDASLEGQQTVENQDAYVLSVDQDIETLGDQFSTALQIYEPEDLGESEEETEEVDEEMVRQSEVYLWVDQDTKEVVRHSYFIDFEFEDEEDGWINFDGRVQFKTEINY